MATSRARAQNPGASAANAATKATSAGGAGQRCRLPRRASAPRGRGAKLDKSSPLAHSALVTEPRAQDHRGAGGSRTSKTSVIRSDAGQERPVLSSSFFSGPHLPREGATQSVYQIRFHHPRGRIFSSANPPPLHALHAPRPQAPAKTKTHTKSPRLALALAPSVP